MIKTEHKLSTKKIKELESLFANDFSSSVFPLLAEHYYNIDDYSRAKKVCEIGLSKNKHNVQGMFVLAKIFNKLNELYKSERLIKKTLTADPVNLNSLLILFEVQQKLNRSNDTIAKTISSILKISPKNIFAKNWMDQNIAKKSSNTKTNKTKETLPKKQSKLVTSIDRSIKIGSNFQTFSMINILIKQKHYQDALHGLKLLAMDDTKKEQAEKYINQINKLQKKENEKNISK